MKSSTGEIPATNAHGTSLGNWLKHASLQDIITASHHSRDFNGSRAEYICLRIRLISFVFALVALFWIPLDYWLLDGADFNHMLFLRIAFSVLFLALGLWGNQPHSLDLARLRMIAFIGIPGLFYIGSRVVLGDAIADGGVLMGYGFLPYVVVSLLALFPLTLVEGLAYALTIGFVVLLTEMAFGTLFSVRAFGEIWLLGLLTSIALWAGLAQLHMLLQLYREATRDALTGLVNRAVLGKWLDREITLAGEREQPLSVMLLDLDLFKRINDTYGHLMGDMVLKVFAQLLIRELPGIHLIGRYGGEEFLAILPGKSSSQALELANRIRTACHKTRILGPENQEIGFTVSIGVAEQVAGETSAELLGRVDKGLYRAKEAGRDLAVQS